MGWTDQEYLQVMAALSNTIEVIGGRPLSDPAMDAYLSQLQNECEDVPIVIRALERCQRECKGYLPLVEVLGRIPKEPERPEWMDEDWSGNSLARFKEELAKRGPEADSIRKWLGVPLVGTTDMHNSE